MWGRFWPLHIHGWMLIVHFLPFQPFTMIDWATHQVRPWSILVDVWLPRDIMSFWWKEGKNGVLRRFLLLRSYRNETENRNREEISFSARIFQGVFQLQKNHRKPTMQDIYIATRPTRLRVSFCHFQIERIPTNSSKGPFSCRRTIDSPPQRRTSI